MTQVVAVGLAGCARVAERGYSVVVPTRDRAASLERCLEAVARAAPDAEVIVVDDGSHDGLAVESVARRHGAEVVRVGRSGAAAARTAPRLGSCSSRTTRFGVIGTSRRSASA